LLPLAPPGFLADDASLARLYGPSAAASVSTWSEGHIPSHIPSNDDNANAGPSRAWAAGAVELGERVALLSLRHTPVSKRATDKLLRYVGKVSPYAARKQEVFTATATTNNNNNLDTNQDGAAAGAGERKKESLFALGSPGPAAGARAATWGPLTPADLSLTDSDGDHGPEAARAGGVRGDDRALRLQRTYEAPRFANVCTVVL
jgi:hypothetical protein